MYFSTLINRVFGKNADPERFQLGKTSGAPEGTPKQAGDTPLPAEGIAATVYATGLFDKDWYLSTYPDLRQVPDPLEHFVHHGIHEGRDPGPGFSSTLYMIVHASELTPGESAFSHYLYKGRHAGFEPVGAESYMIWRKLFDTLDQDDCAAMVDQAARENFAATRIVHVFDNDACDFAEEIIAGWRGQILGNWNASIIFDQTVPPQARGTVVSLIAQDSRIGVVNSEEVGEMGVSDQILLVHGAAKLAPYTSYLTQEATLSQNCHIAYGDEDVFSNNAFQTPHFKPIFSPQLMRSDFYIGRLIAFARHRPQHIDLTKLIDGLVRGTVDPITQTLIQARRFDVVHVPFVLTSSALHAARPAFTSQPKAVDTYRPKVSILILTRDKIDLMADCVDSILQKSTYPRDQMEIVAVDNGSVTPEALQWFSEHEHRPGFKIIHAPIDFNFAALNNLAAREASGEILILLNNDTLVIEPDWMERLVTHCLESDVAAVGVKLLFPDDTIQHGGCTVGFAGLAAHRGKDQTHLDVASTDFTRELTAVTGACLAVRRDVYEQLNGLDETLKVAFNDIKFCLDAVSAGYRNIYITEPLLYHLESKSRGFDITLAQRHANLREAIYTRSKHRHFFQNDAYYSPNLSQVRMDGLAFPPRRALPWRKEKGGHTRRIMLVSITHTIGSGVAVVINEQAKRLVAAGYQVFIAGPHTSRDWDYVGCTRVIVSDALAAANIAVREKIDLVIVHTPPFYSMIRYLGSQPMIYFIDHGEPNPEFFPDAAQRHDINWEKRFCQPIAKRVFAISNAIRDQAIHSDMVVTRNGNSHLSRWNNDMVLRRNATRKLHGWDDKLVIFNVCRFSADEQFYKGVDRYIEAMKELWFRYPETNGKVVFALAGKGAEDDIQQLTKDGLFVRGNLADSEIIDLQAAADLYINFSKWEGYNLGIGQALAMGLPVVASDIEAHREFPIKTTNSTRVAIDAIYNLWQRFQNGDLPPRAPFIEEWDVPVGMLLSIIREDLG